MRSTTHHHWASLLVLLAALLPFGPARAEIVQIPIDGKTRAAAQFIQGDADAPAVLLLHGFLQTREFPTIRRLATSLAESGVTVLAPTLSLDINLRKQSLACEAIHTNSFEDDLKEIELWANWLHEKTGQEIILLGHSMGSIHLIGYLLGQQKPPIKRSILVSLSYFGERRFSYETEESARRAREAAGRNDQNLLEFGLGHCKKYITSGANFLSYYNWSKENTLKTLGMIDTPTSVIIGEADQRVDRDWIQQLQASGVDVRPVDEANHFFDSTHEFDLQEVVEDILRQM